MNGSTVTVQEVLDADASDQITIGNARLAVSVLAAEVLRLRVNNEQLRDACADHLLRFGRLHDEADKYQVRALEAEAEVKRLRDETSRLREADRQAGEFYAASVADPADSVSRTVYEQAVKGRQDMRDAYKTALDEVKRLRSSTLEVVSYDKQAMDALAALRPRAAAVVDAVDALQGTHPNLDNVFAEAERLREELRGER